MICQKQTNSCRSHNMITLYTIRTRFFLSWFFFIDIFRTMHTMSCDIVTAAGMLFLWGSERMENILLSHSGIDIYESDIMILCDEYISRLPDQNSIYKSAVFAGMLRYIYQHKIRDVIETDRNNNTLKRNENNYILLNDIFNNIYIYLCSLYNIVPSIIQFCSLVDIDRDVLSDLNKGFYGSTGRAVNADNSRTVKKWFNTCESMLLSKAQNESSIGSIFALKANYGYRDNIQQIEVLPTQHTQSAEQIKERYKSAQLPVMDE